MLLAGQKVVVVGGSSGIGLSTAELAKSEGADVTIASRNAERLKAAAEKLGVKSMPADVTSDESVAQLFQQCGMVNHVVVTAAQLRTGPFKTVPMGATLIYSQRFFESPTVFAYIVVMLAVGLVVDAVMRRFQNRFLRWAEG